MPAIQLRGETVNRNRKFFEVMNYGEAVLVGGDHNLVRCSPAEGPFIGEQREKYYLSSRLPDGGHKKMPKIVNRNRIFV